MYMYIDKPTVHIKKNLRVLRDSSRELLMNANCQCIFCQFHAHDMLALYTRVCALHILRTFARYRLIARGSLVNLQVFKKLYYTLINLHVT